MLTGETTVKVSPTSKRTEMENSKTEQIKKSWKKITRKSLKLCDEIEKYEKLEQQTSIIARVNSQEVSIYHNSGVGRKPSNTPT